MLINNIKQELGTNTSNYISSSSTYEPLGNINNEIFTAFVFLIVVVVLSVIVYYYLKIIIMEAHKNGRRKRKVTKN